MTKTFESLIPSIEARESGWMRIRERLAHPHQVPSHPSVTISRQYGCEGYSLAQRLKVLLEEASGQPWNLFDKALVDKVASDEPLSRQLLGHLGDESHAQDVLRAHFGHLTHDDAYAKLVEHLVQIATAGCAIIVGRGGAVVCQDLKNCFHFRLEGSFDFRVATLARRLEMSPADAEKLVAPSRSSGRSSSASASTPTSPPPTGTTPCSTTNARMWRPSPRPACAS